MTENEFLAQAARILHPMKPMPVLYKDVLDRLRETADPEEVAELKNRVEQLEEECAQAEDERDEVLVVGEQTQTDLDVAEDVLRTIRRTLEGYPE